MKRTWTRSSKRPDTRNEPSSFVSFTPALSRLIVGLRKPYKERTQPCAKSLRTSESSQKALQLTSTLEEENWGRVQMDHQEARQLIHRAEWSVSIVSTVTLLFSVWASLILP